MTPRPRKPILPHPSMLSSAAKASTGALGSWWVTVRKSLPSVARHPTAVASQASAGRVAAAFSDGYLAAKGWFLEGMIAVSCEGRGCLGGTRHGEQGRCWVRLH